MTETNTPKVWWKSRTILFNVGTALVILGTEGTSFGHLMPEEHRETLMGLLLIASTFGNIILRSFTQVPVTTTKQK